MAMTQLEQAQSRLAAYLVAETAILANQRYQIADRELQRAPLEFVQKQIEKLNAEIATLSTTNSGRPRTRYAVIG
jgi:hypothetical protein